jgi:CheY-like chemotaxis protein
MGTLNMVKKHTCEELEKKIRELEKDMNHLEQFEDALRYRAKLETLVADISTSFINISSKLVDDTINIISTRNRYVERPIMGYENTNIGAYAVMTVSDNGSGISSDHLERIFEPFFAKKVMGRSDTGLGLAVVWNIMQDHEEYIDVTSDKNGTAFDLYFPITRNKEIHKGLSISLEDYKGDGEIILVVDDVKSQREITCNMLNVLGYKAIAVSSGEKAVEHLQENRADIVLLDMIMDPGINGLETYKRIVKIHPNQKAILVSGFAETHEVKEAQKLGAGQYIRKPLKLKSIGTAIKKELEN